MNVARLAAFASIAALSASTLSPSAFSAAPHGHEAGPRAQPLTLDQGKRWATDAPLRDNMRALRAALAPKLAAIDEGTLSKDEYRALGQVVEKRVADIVAKCKLPPAADANLHLIVGGLIAAANSMQGKEPTVKPAMGAARAVRLVDQYGTYFDDPGFQPLSTTAAHGGKPEPGAVPPKS